MGPPPRPGGPGRTRKHLRSQSAWVSVEFRVADPLNSAYCSICFCPFIPPFPLFLVPTMCSNLSYTPRARVYEYTQLGIVGTLGTAVKIQYFSVFPLAHYY